MVGTFSHLASTFYKPVQRSQNNEQVSKNISDQFAALKGSSTIISINDIKFNKERRYTDHFEENQNDLDSSVESHHNQVSPVGEDEGSSTSDDSQESSID